MPPFLVFECDQCKRKFKNDQALQQVKLIYMLSSILYANSPKSINEIHRRFIRPSKKARNLISVLHAMDHSDTNPTLIITPGLSILGLPRLRLSRLRLSKLRLSRLRPSRLRPPIHYILALYAIGRSNTSPPLIVTLELSIERNINRIVALYAVGRSWTKPPSTITLKPSITGARPALGLSSR